MAVYPLHLMSMILRALVLHYLCTMLMRFAMKLESEN